MATVPVSIHSNTIYVKACDQYDEYIKNELNIFQLETPFPSEITESEFKNEDIFNNIDEFQLIGEYNNKNWFSRSYFNTLFMRTFVVKYICCEA